MSNQRQSARGQRDDDIDDAADDPEGHLDGVEDGCGCTEIWEHLSEQRENNAD
ncbi:hypothetical protein [Haloarcula nitratireducens]|uniref:Uncharacterized protein n=1 Tax=Haloarcula nitratireducens TaxID=2487749 RepID=A0AAW4P849_9EURY|nr:hypothetical protein [Halomicroarcula nitratireducens]MBX0294019.1 hypothetical protein [Halomicroarcula nitratireducens]